jgi:hypothetical protein
MNSKPENNSAGSFKDWVIMLIIAALVSGWGLFVYFRVQDRPRQWDFGVLPDAPSQSIYSTTPPPGNAAVPTQTPVLPEATPWQADKQKKTSPADSTAAPTAMSPGTPVVPAVPSNKPAAPGEPGK